MKLDTNKNEATAPLAEHLFKHALESGNVDSNARADWDYDGWTMLHITLHEDTGNIEVHAEQSVSETGKQIGGGRGPSASHPPEYEHHDGTLMAVATIDFGDGALSGDCHVHIEQHGGKPLPPDPEPEWRDL